MTTENINFAVTANQSSAGDYLPIDSDTLGGCTVTNGSAYAVEYSTGGAWTTIAASGSATINTGAIATTSLRFRKKTGDSTPVVLSVAVTHPGTTPAQLATDAAGNLSFALPLGASASVNKPVDAAHELPVWLRGEYLYNSMSHDNVIVKDGVMWCVAWKDSLNAFLFRRPVNSSVWSYFDLGTISGNPLSTAVSDSHNFLSIAISGDGKIHISGNMHNNALRYVVCNSVANWNSAGAWSSGSMVGTQESDVTYPCFIDTVDGNLLFFYRDGVSSNGLGYINKYDKSTGLWTRLSTLFGNGKVPTHANSTSNAYPSRFVLDATGRLHVTFTWRGAGTADDNWAISYAYSDDKGVTWKKSDGSTYSLPIQPATSDVVLNTASSGSGLLNSALNGLSVDAAGKVHAVCMRRDGSSYTQFYYITNKSGSWVTTAVTGWDYTYDISVNPISNIVARPDIACMPDGRVLIIYRHSARERGALWALDVTNTSYTRRFKLVDVDLQAYEPVYSGQALRETGRLVMLCCVCQANGNASTDGEYYIANNWYSQLGFIIDTQASPDSRVPRMELIGCHSANNTSTSGTNIVSTSDVAVLARAPFPMDSSGAKPMFRVRAMVRQNTSGTGTISVAETQIGGTSSTTPTLVRSTLSTVAPLVSPLLASRKFTPDQTYRTGYIDLMAKVSAGSMDVFGVQIDVLKLAN